MPRVSMKELLGDALERGYAVGYFESWSMESLEGVAEAAEEERSPVIIGFGGSVTEPGWLESPGIDLVAGMSDALASRATVPVSTIVNEAVCFEQVERAVKCGVDIVSMDTSSLPFEENAAVTRRIVELAHPAGVAVEAELGHLPMGMEGLPDEGECSTTDSYQAAEFIKRTGIDALAVSVGNVHVLADGKATIDVERIGRVRDAARVPLVIHGGTGFPDGAVAEAIASGVAKFNVGAVLKQSFLRGVAEAGREMESTKRFIMLGSRQGEDPLSAGRVRMKEEVKRLMRIYGSSGKA